MSQDQQQPVVQTELDNIYERLSGLNSRFISDLQGLDKIGHRLKNTNFPIESANKSQTEQEPDGALQQIQRQLDYYNNHVIFLENIIEKLSKLL